MSDGAQQLGRYARQIVLPEVGATGQARIAASSALVVGAGGLGCALLQYLCAAGVGRITIIDHDRVELTNLHRQPLYRTSDCGRFKAESARALLMQLNPEIEINSICARLTPANAPALIADSDVIVDAADSFAVTYALSDECLRARKPLVSASVIGHAGYVGAFCADAPSYRAVFPDMPAQAGSCAQSGVLGTAVGVLGTLQAHCVLALILQADPPVLGRLLTVDLRALRFGGFSFHKALEPADVIPFIAQADVDLSDIVIDLRSRVEAPESPFPTALRMTVDEVSEAADCLSNARRVVLCCRSGLRAWRAAAALRATGHQRLALLALGDS